MIVMRIFSFFFLFNEFLRNLVIENNLLFLFVGIFFLVCPNYQMSDEN